MARQARTIVPGVAHHVTQRGNRREAIFLQPGDEAVYLDLMSTQLRRRDVACWAYCLRPNHVHLILTPEDGTGLALAVGEAHRRYTAFIGARGGLAMVERRRPHRRAKHAACFGRAGAGAHRQLRRPCGRRGGR